MDPILQKLQTIHKTYLALGVFAVLILVLYGLTLQNGFVQDDHTGIEQNTYVQSLRYLPSLLTGCIEHATGQCEGVAVYYRPMQSFSYMMTYQISSQPWAFHFTNVVYFFGIVSLIFLVAKSLTQNAVLAFAASLIFLIHPILYEVVGWASAVPELLLALFVLLATFFYIQDRQHTATRGIWNRHVILASFFYFLAMLSKEPAVVLPAVFLFLDIFFFKIPIRTLLYWKEVQRYAVLFGMFCAYILLRMSALGGFASAEGYYGPFSVGERIFAFVTLFAQYLKNFVYPQPLLFLYTFEKQSDFTTPQFFLSVLILVAFAVALVFLVKRGKVFLAFSLLWIVAFLATVLLFVDHLGESVFAERYLFVSSIGFAFAGGSFVSFLWKRGKRLKTAVVLSGIALSFVSFVVVYGQHEVWRNDESLYRDILLKNPYADTMRFNWAVSLRNDYGDFERAKEEFETIELQNPGWRTINMVYFHLGDYYREIGDWERARDYYQKSIVDSLQQNDWKGQFAHNRMAEFYVEEEQYVAALPHLCEALRLRPDDARNQARFNQVSQQIAEEYEDNPARLYDDIVESPVFEQSNISNIRFVHRTCEGDLCTFVFALAGRRPEVILPFLILGRTDLQEIADITGSAMSPDGSMAQLQTDARFEDDRVTFLFPTCDARYYEIVAE